MFCFIIQCEMNNSFSLQQIQKTSNLDANLISRQYKLNLMADFLRVKYENPKMKHCEKANQLGMSFSTVQRYRNDINMLSQYQISPNNTKKRSKKAKIDDNSDHKRPQLTSNDVKTTSNETVKNKKNKLKGGSLQENIEINEHYLDKILKNNNIKMELAIQFISNDNTVRNDTIQDLKEFNQQSSTTQAEKGKQLTAMMPAIKKAFNVLGDDIIELSTENDVLKNQIGEYDEKWLQESKAKLLKDIDDKKRADLIMFRMKKQMNKK